jgi:hypothetical protein
MAALLVTVLFVTVLFVTQAALWGAERDLPKDCVFLARPATPEVAGLSQALDSLLAGTRGDGGGASVANLLAVQWGYLDEDNFQGLPASFLTLFWTNPTVNINGIQVFVDGLPLPDLSGNPVILPGDATTIDVVAFAGGQGPARFEVIGDGTTSADDIVILAHQPFDDPEGFHCEGGVRNPVDSTCDLNLVIPAGRPPDFFFVSFNGGPYLDETIPGTERVHAFPDYRPGPYNITLLGAISSDGNDYLGDPTTSPCDLVCKDLPCDIPLRIGSCQNAFGPSAADNKVALSWINGETYYTEIRLAVDAQPRDPLKGDATETLLEDLAPGDHDVTLQGDCGDKGLSDPAAYSFKVVGSAPQVNPIGDLTCRFLLPDSSKLVASWRNNSPASYIELYLVDPQDSRRKVLTVAGQASSATIEGTVKTDRVAVRSFYQQDGACFSSDFASCTPKPPPGFKYLTGDCDGNSNTNLTDAIFSLNFLFKGGGAPHCSAACDANTDELFNLADPVYVLNHLFLGGPPPGGKFPACDQSGPDQSCGETTCFR